MSLASILLTIGLSTLLLTGCAVKPEPLNEALYFNEVMNAKRSLYLNQPPLTESLSLPMAIARALTYNYDHRLALMEAAFQSSTLTAANLAMLPKLTVSAGYTARDNDAASRSISYHNRQQTLEPSISQERERTISDLSFNWSILDFGISYFQAKQYANRYLIMEERRRRVINNIVKDVVTTYWSVAMSDSLLPLVQTALKDTEKALASYSTARASGLTPLIGSLDEEKRLIQISSGLKRVAADLAQSKIHLAALVNIPMGESYSIVIPEDTTYLRPPSLPDHIGQAEDTALYMRPDLREDSYQERIDKHELHKEIVRMIPNINLVVSKNADSNMFLYNNFWAEGTLRVASNLIGLIGNYYQYKAAKTQIEVTRTRKLANMIAALVQVRLAYHQYAIALQDYHDSVIMQNLEQQIYSIVREGTRDGSISEQERINRHTDMIAASLSKLRSLRAVYESWGNFYFSLGGDLVKKFPEDATLEAKAALIQSGLERWWAGNLPALPELAAAQLPPVQQTQAAPIPDPPKPEIPASERFDYVYQIATYKHFTPAERMNARLLAAGIQAHVEQNGAWHRILVQFRGDSQDTDTLQAKLATLDIEKILLRSKKRVREE